MRKASDGERGGSRGEKYTDVKGLQVEEGVERKMGTRLSSMCERRGIKWKIEREEKREKGQKRKRSQEGANKDKRKRASISKRNEG